MMGEKIRRWGKVSENNVAQAKKKKKAKDLPALPLAAKLSFIHLPLTTT